MQIRLFAIALVTLGWLTPAQTASAMPNLQPPALIEQSMMQKRGELADLAICLLCISSGIYILYQEFRIYQSHVLQRQVETLEKLWKSN
jgi:hypothetical protein